MKRRQEERKRELLEKAKLEKELEAGKTKSTQDAYDLVKVWKKSANGNVIQMLKSIHSIIPEKIPSPISLPDDPPSSKVCT